MKEAVSSGFIFCEMMMRMRSIMRMMSRTRRMVMRLDIYPDFSCEKRARGMMKDARRRTILIVK